MALLHGDRHTDPRPPVDVRTPAVPTQAVRTSRTPALAPTTVQAPRPRPASGRRRTALAVAVTTLLTLGVGATSTAVTLQENARRAEVVRQNVAVAAAAQAADVELQRRAEVAHALAVRQARAEELAARGAAVAKATPQVEAARAALAAAPQASVESRAALQSAIDAAARLTAADPLPFVGEMRRAVAALAQPQQDVAASQAAWRAAEDARLAAEAQAAAVEQARAAVEQARAARPASRSARSAAPARSRASAPAPVGARPAPAAPAPAPAAAGVPEFSAGAVGEAINAHRAANGLPPLSISRSGTLYAHASAMAQAGSIWHGGSDKIVGYVRPASVSSLVRAWASSPAHNAWMLRAGVTSMQIGAAQLDGRLYGAVDFR